MTDCPQLINGNCSLISKPVDQRICKMCQSQWKQQVPTLVSLTPILRHFQKRDPVLQSLAVAVPAPRLSVADRMAAIEKRGSGCGKCRKRKELEGHQDSKDAPGPIETPAPAL